MKVAKVLGFAESNASAPFVAAHAWATSPVWPAGKSDMPHEFDSQEVALLKW